MSIIQPINVNIGKDESELGENRGFCARSLRESNTQKEIVSYGPQDISNLYASISALAGPVFLILHAAAVHEALRDGVARGEH